MAMESRGATGRRMPLATCHLPLPLPLATAIAQTFFGVFRLRFAELQIISQEFTQHKSLRKEFQIRYLFIAFSSLHKMQNLLIILNIKKKIIEGIIN